MMKKVLALLIVLLALSLPAAALAQEQTAPASTQTPAATPTPSPTAPDSASSTAAASDESDAQAAETDGPDFYKIGLAHYESKKFKDAVEAFKRASKLKPKDADIQYNLGLAYYSSNQYKEAAKAYEQAARLRPDWSDAHFRLGWMYYILGKKDSSFEQYEILQKLNPSQAATLYRIIKVEEKEAKAEKAESKRAKKPAPPVEAKEDAKVESRLVVSEFSQPASPSTETAPATNAATEKPAEPKDSSADATGATTDAATNSTAPASSADASITSDASTASIASTATSTTSDEASLVRQYRVGVGDVLDIRLMNTPTPRSTLYTVMEGGLIDYPLAGGPINVNGLTTEEINARLSSELKRRAVNPNPNEIVVSVRDYVSHNVVISGLVNSPGMRILHREAVPLYVVLADAQPRMEASRAVIMRASGQIQVDLTDPAQMNVLVRPGDVITVSARPPQFYYLGGKVMTPGQKPFQQGITLVQALLAAGGLERASGEVIEISREGADGRLTTTRYKLKDIRAGKVPDPRLQPGDRIEVNK